MKGLYIVCGKNLPDNLPSKAVVVTDLVETLCDRNIADHDIRAIYERFLNDLKETSTRSTYVWVPATKKVPFNRESYINDLFHRAVRVMTPPVKARLTWRFLAPVPRWVWGAA